MSPEGLKDFRSPTRKKTLRALTAEPTPQESHAAILLSVFLSSHNHHYRALGPNLAGSGTANRLPPQMGLPVLEPLTRGVVLALFSVAVASIGAAFFLGAVPSASPDLLQTLALIGAILLPAYVVEVIWLLPRMGNGEELEEWLGFVVGAGIADLVAIAVALLGVQHRLAGHANWLDDLGLAFVVVSLVVLAGTLVAQPLLAHRFEDASDSPGDRSQ